MPAKDQRIVIFCLSLETIKVYKAIEHYGADKAYMLYWATKSPYPEFKKEIISHFKGQGWELEPIEVRTYDFSPTLAKLMSIITSKENGSARFYVDITGTSAYSAAAMVACMMTPAEPFFISTKEYTLQDPEAFFVDGKPFGMSLEVGDKPMELATFPVEQLSEKEVRGLREWRAIKESGVLPTYPRVIRALDRKGLIELRDKEGKLLTLTDEKGRLNSELRHRASMYYKRNFLEKWVDQGWLVKDKEGEYNLSGQGKVVTEVFYVD